jgi:hypothetical protein
MAISASGLREGALEDGHAGHAVGPLPEPERIPPGMASTTRPYRPPRARS